MNKSAVVQLISRKAWIYSGVSFAVLAGLMGYVFIKCQLFEAFYDLTRDHEDWQMDHVFMVLLACLMAFSTVLFVLTIHFGRHLLETSNKLIEAERQISRGRQLVALGTMLGGAAHSINNHLTPIVGLAQLLKSETDPASEEYQDLATIEAAAQGAAKLMKQLKTLARGEDGMVETCAMSQALNGALDLVCNVVPSKITVTREIQALAGRVALSSVAVEVLVFNLVNNSIDAIRPGTGTIAVRLLCCAAPAVHSAAKEQEWVRIEVQDSGHGMTEEQKSRMFDPFFTTKPVGVGTGLGLSESFGLVQKAGGIFDVLSSERSGTTVAVYLPLTG